MLSSLFACLSVYLFVCQHDNFRTIKRRTMKPVLYKNLARVRIWGQRSKVKVTRDKKRQSVAFFSGSVLEGTVLGGHACGVCLGKHL